MKNYLFKVVFNNGSYVLMGKGFQRVDEMSPNKSACFDTFDEAFIEMNKYINKWKKMGQCENAMFDLFEVVEVGTNTTYDYYNETMKW